MENDISLGQVVWYTQLIDGIVGREPSVVHAKQLFGIEELKVELSGLNKMEGHALGLGAGIPTCTEEVSYRSCECGPRVNVSDERRRRETVLFFFFSGANEVVPPKDGPVRLGELNAFVPKALDDMIEPRVLVGQRKESAAMTCWLVVAYPLTFALSSAE